VTTTLAIIGIVIALGSLVVSIRATRTANAAMERQAGANERLVEIEQARDAAYEPRWDVYLSTGSTYQLRNETGESAIDVALSGERVTSIEQPTSWNEIRPGETRSFMATRGMGGSPWEIEITWRRRESPRPYSFTASLL
jgi:hypothetical protein